MMFINKPKLPTTFEGRVIDVKSASVIVKVNGQNVMVKTKEDLNYGDTISFDGNYIRIKGQSNVKGFNVEKYYHQNNIHYEIKPFKIEVIKSKSTLQSNLFHRVNNHSDQLYLQKLFFNINHYELDQNLSSLLLSSGIIIRSIIQYLKKILQLYLYHDKIFYIECFLLLILYIVFKTQIIFLSLLISRLISKLKIERIDQIFLSSILILLIFPHYFFSLSFSVGFLFKLTSFIQVNKNRLILNSIILIPIQLLNFYSCNLFEIILFSYYRVIGIISYLLGILDLCLKTSLSYSFSSFFYFTNKSLVLTGHLPKILIILWIIVSLKLLQKPTFLRLSFLIVLLFINQHQLLFNPSLSYTQIYIGQGDAALITYPFRNKVMMIDTGSNFQEKKLQTTLDYYGVKTISHLVISHDDEDHSGNKEFLMNNYKVEDVIESDTSFNFYNLEVSSVSYDSDNDNDSSLITMFSVNDYLYLSLGDVSSDVERKFLREYPYEWNIIKMSHHGSNTGTSEEILSLPSLALLINSSGLNNMYKHPSLEVLKRIHKYQQLMLDTQDIGDIQIIHFLMWDFIKI